MLLNHEELGGYGLPGIFTIKIDGVGALSVYHQNLFLGSLRQNHIVTRDYDTLRYVCTGRRVLLSLSPYASKIALALNEPENASICLRHLFTDWGNTISRLCIGLRRIGTGGSLLITPNPIVENLHVTHPLQYQRLGHSLILSVLDSTHDRRVRKNQFDELEKTKKTISGKLFWKGRYARGDKEDRDHEVTGAVKFVTSLATVDGLVLLNPLLEVLGFGVKIDSEINVKTVYDGESFLKHGTGAKIIDISNFGTRHGSMLRYCHADHKAIGIVVSQDGHVRMIMTIGRSLVLWENVRLLRHTSDVRDYAEDAKKHLLYLKKHKSEEVLGYSKMPKTIDELIKHHRQKQDVPADA
jgi:hypothetical protein